MAPGGRAGPPFPSAIRTRAATGRPASSSMWSERRHVSVRAAGEAGGQSSSFTASTSKPPGSGSLVSSANRRTIVVVAGGVEKRNQPGRQPAVCQQLVCCRAEPRALPRSSRNAASTPQKPALKRQLFSPWKRACHWKRYFRSGLIAIGEDCHCSEPCRPSILSARPPTKGLSVVQASASAASGPLNVQPSGRPSLVSSKEGLGTGNAPAERAVTKSSKTDNPRSPSRIAQPGVLPVVEQAGDRAATVAGQTEG